MGQVLQREREIVGEEVTDLSDEALKRANALFQILSPVGLHGEERIAELIDGKRVYIRKHTEAYFSFRISDKGGYSPTFSINAVGLSDIWLPPYRPLHRTMELEKDPAMDPRIPDEAFASFGDIFRDLSLPLVNWVGEAVFSGTLREYPPEVLEKIRYLYKTFGKWLPK